MNYNTINLRHKGKRQKPRETRGRFNIGNPISKSLKFVKNREDFGHWELDSVVSSRGESKGCLSTFVERKSRFLVALKMSNRSSSSMEESILEILRMFPNRAFKTATVDR